MAGKSVVGASEEQKAALRTLAGPRDRGEADRARAMLLTLSGWTSPRIAEAFGVREDTVRVWRSAAAGRRRSRPALRQDRPRSRRKQRCAL